MVFFLAGLVVLVAPQGAHAQATPVIDPATTIPGEAPTEEDSTFSAAAVGSIQFNQPSYTILSGTTATASLTITMTSTTTNGTVEIFGLASAIPVAPASVTPSGGGTCSFNQPPGGGTVQVFFGSSGAGSCVITFTISEDGSGFPNGTIVANSQVNFIPLNIVRATVSFVSPLSAGSPTFNIPFGTPYNGTLPVAGGKTPYTFSILSPPSTGSVTLTNAATGAFSFTPAPNQFGTFTFTFRVMDSTDVAQPASGTVSLVIASPPVVANSGSLAVPYAGQADGVLDATGGDGTLTFSEDVPPQKGSVTIDPITGRYTYVASPGQTGGDSFTFRATDGSQPALSDTGRIDVTIAPPPLIATNLDLDVAYEGSVSDTITTSGGTPPLTFVVANQPLKGTVMLDETTGAFTYDAGEGETGPDSFTATITDGGTPPQITTATVTLTLAPEPLATTNLDLDVAFEESIDGAIAHTGGTLPVEFTISAPATRGSVDLDQATGEFTYTAGTNQTGTDVFTITIVDSGTPQQDATATVTVTIGAPGALVAESLTLSVTPGETVLSDLRSAVSGGFPPYTFAGATPSQQGSVTIDPDGAFRYTADSTASGTDSFTYTVTDSETMGVSAATTVEGTVFIAFQAEEPSPTPTATSSPVPSPTPSPTMPGSDMTPTAISTRGPATVPGTMPVHDYPTSAVPIDPTLANGGGVSQLPATGQGTRTGTMPVWLVLLLAGLLVASAMVMRYLWPARR